tara:strand:+ start:473 stop:706 length:234 start_codon:yes stop_codon:yes gene_type:complete
MLFGGTPTMLFNNKDVKSEQQMEVDYLHEAYEGIALRLEVISDIIDEIVTMYPDKREQFNIEKRIQQKLMLRKLAGE